MRGESKSKLELVQNEWTEVELTTPYGKMILNSKALEISRSKKHLFVRYVLYQGKERIDEISLRWDLIKSAIS